MQQQQNYQGGDKEWVQAFHKRDDVIYEQLLLTNDYTWGEREMFLVKRDFSNIKHKLV